MDNIPEVDVELTTRASIELAEEIAAELEKEAEEVSIASLLNE